VTARKKWSARTRRNLARKLRQEATSSSDQRAVGLHACASAVEAGSMCPLAALRVCQETRTPRSGEPVT